MEAFSNLLKKKQSEKQKKEEQSEKKTIGKNCMTLRS